MSVYYCYPFGQSMDGTYIKAKNKAAALRLAMNRLRLPAHLVTVERSLDQLSYPGISF